MDSVLTARLRIRPLRRTDLRALQELYGDPELMRYVTGHARSPWQTRARLKKDLAHHRQHGIGLCLAMLRETGEVVGRCGLEPRVVAEGIEGELAWMVARRWWGQGFATEMGRVSIEEGRSLGLVRVYATVHPDNAGSIRVAERLGMRLVRERDDGDLEYEIEEIGRGGRPSDG